MELNLTTAREYIRDLAMNAPEYVYEPPLPNGSCVYINPNNDQPSCILGQLFVNKQGVPVTRVRWFDSEFNLEGVVNGGDAARELGWDDDAANYLEYIQHQQDSGRAWGQAYNKAESLMAGGYTFNNDGDVDLPSS